MSSMHARLLGAVFDLEHPAHVVEWHFVQLSVANIVSIGLIVAVFALAIALPFGGSSWIRAFGTASAASLAVTLASGMVLALKGPAWWHDTGAGHFFNSVHLWAVELLFLAMVVHLWGQYWMAAWRGGRARVWATGAVAFLVALPGALTGYISQQDFDAQWISTQARGAMNSVGVGAFFNVTNFGQMYTYHVLLLPAAVIALVLAHVLLVRRHGAVPSFEPVQR